ncbi:MAG: hypothetical protein ACE5GY_01960 [Thermodesulfobacteriota bacterium]
MFSKLIKQIKPLLLAGIIISAATASVAATKAPEAPAQVKPPYDTEDALLSIMNPHEQIDDEGMVLWRSCLVCHTEVPDLKKKNTIKDVKVRYSDENYNKICRSCHTVRKHPGSEGISATMASIVAPDHLVVPPKKIYMNIRLTKKEIPMMMPLDPETGKIICSTCHNPHERGLLPGRADWGGDYLVRLRSAGLEMCQYCHRK